MKLAGYDYLVEYKRGSENLATYALSRRVEEVEANIPLAVRAITTVEQIWLQSVKEMVENSEKNSTRRD